MASGMGIPSIGIYSHELFSFYGVENIIRIGSAGAISEKLKLLDIVLALGACTNSAYAAQYMLPGAFAPIADYGLMKTAIEKCMDAGAAYHVGNLLSSDTFYTDDAAALSKWIRMGVLAVEMEAAGLYMNAARAGKRALAICTVSDHILTGDQAGADMERVEEALKRLELVYVEMEPGDTLFFHCNLLHRSDQNRSANPRWSMICCYNAARNDPYKESHHPRYTPLVKVTDSAVREAGARRFADSASEVGFLDPVQDRSAASLTKTE
jgi:DeoD family purine-nucleoside phosphorylase